MEGAAHFISLLCLLNGRKSIILDLIFLIFLCAIEEILIYHIGLLSAQFYYILLLKDVHKFYVQLVITFGLILFIALIKSSKNFVSSVLYIEWREYTSKLLISKYFNNENFYVFNATNGNAKSSLHSKAVLDNIDQRMSQDVDKLCAELSSIISQIVLSPFTIIYYSFQVYFTLGFFGLISCISIFLLSTLVNRFFVKAIVKWTYLKGKHEGDYRAEHANIMKHFELIAFSNTTHQQKSKILALLKILLSVHENLILSQFYLNISTAIFDYSGSILSFIIIAFPIFGGHFDHLNEAELSRKISSNAFICIYLINCFSRIIDISSNFGHINGFGYRITELLSEFKHNQTYRFSRHVADSDPSIFLQLANINFTSLFSEKQAIKDLSFIVRQNENVFICGDSGLGKTTILRIIKGLWPISSGVISCNLDLNNPKQVMFLLHNSNFSYFLLEDIQSDLDHKDIFKFYLYEYSLDFTLNQEMAVNRLENLSPGQVQIMNFLFVFCYRPKLIFLDEATNSLPDQMADKLYTECNRLKITVVSLTNNENLKKFHSCFIQLNEFT